MKQFLKMLVIGLAGVVVSVSPAFASTGPFAGPLTNAFLSVDINGGVNASGGSTTEGTDSAGVTWSPWGGPASTGGDNTQLPNNTAGVSSSTISKTFGAVTVTVSLEPTNTAAYASGFTINSRDRATPTGATNDNDMFRDFIFAATGGGKQGQNFLLLQFSGLTPGGTYTIAVYSFDSQNALSMNWTATAPTLTENRFSWWNNPPNGNFTAPSDQQTITWASGATAMQAPAVFTVSADNNGVIKLYGYGGDGVTGNNSSSSSYLNGFQIATGTNTPPTAGTTTYIVDDFAPAGVGPGNPTNHNYYQSANNYANGQITNVYGNWFGGAFQSLSWDSASDASNDVSSGSLKINLDFSAANNQFAVWNQGTTNNFYALNISTPPYTNFECDVRFAPGSASDSGSFGSPIFGHLRFGNRTAAYSQDWFCAVDVAATNTSWVHVSVPLNVVANPSLTNILGLIINIDRGFYGLNLNGASTLWVDNIKFSGSSAVSSNSAPAFVAGGVTRLPDGNISLTATGTGGVPYRLWATTDVALSPTVNTWTLLNSGTVSVSPFTITDLTATNFPHRFYQFSSP